MEFYVISGVMLFLWQYCKISCFSINTHTQTRASKENKIQHDPDRAQWTYFILTMLYKLWNGTTKMHHWEKAVVHGAIPYSCKANFSTGSQTAVIIAVTTQFPVRYRNRLWISWLVTSLTQTVEDSKLITDCPENFSALQLLCLHYQSWAQSIYV